MQREEPECAEELEEQLINEEYKIWKKNSPFLYDTVITHALEWPSLTVDWLPVKETPAGCDYSVQKLVIGTHTSKQETENLIIAQVKLPLEESMISGKVYLDNTKDSGGIGLLSKTDNKIELQIKINHDGEVNRARAMPQQYNVIATKGPSGEVFIYDYTKHPSKSTLGPQLRLQGHQKEGYGLEWSGQKKGWLASGSDDHLVCVWDINSATELNSTLQPVVTFNQHDDIVGDVSWSEHHENTLASVGDDKKLMLWDMRASTPTHIVDAHIDDIHSVDFNKQDEFLLATSSSDKTVAIWDLRKLELKLASLEYHKDAVYSVRWAPFSGTLLGSSGSDRRVCLWDLSKIGSEQTAEDAEDGPPELIFIHGGHTSKVSDFSWNMNDQLTIASVAEDNILQIWQMSHALFTSPDLQMLSEDRMDLE
jgi:histone-binding protein RBBP4